MTGAEIAAAVFLWTGIAIEVACIIGLVWLRDPFDGLHFVAVATTAGPVLIAVAVVMTGFSSLAGTTECVAACAVLFVLNPVLTSATGRTGRDLLYGDLDPRPDEWERQP